MGSYLDSPGNLQTYQDSMNDSDARWRELYEAALLELDRDKLLQCIELAERAIVENRQVVERYPQAPEELQAMNDALHALSLLRRSALRE